MARKPNNRYRRSSELRRSQTERVSQAWCTSRTCEASCSLGPNCSRPPEYLVLHYSATRGVRCRLPLEVLKECVADVILAEFVRTGFGRGYAETKNESENDEHRGGWHCDERDGAVDMIRTQRGLKVRRYDYQ